MNRDIKFRAWHKQEKKIYDVSVINFNKGAFLQGLKPVDQILNGKYIVRSLEDGRFCDFKDIELMQYTGLKDKNSKEIYEGYILNVHKFTQELAVNLGVYEGEKEFNASVTLEPYGGVTLKHSKEYAGYLLEDNYGFHEESVEIIGNIYENPELLEEKS